MERFGGVVWMLAKLNPCGIRNEGRKYDDEQLMRIPHGLANRVTRLGTPHAPFMSVQEGRSVRSRFLAKRRRSLCGHHVWVQSTVSPQPRSRCCSQSRVPVSRSHLPHVWHGPRETVRLSLPRLKKGGVDHLTVEKVGLPLNSFE